MKTTTCPKCDGAKYLPCFAHYAAGVCFGCNGAGVVRCEPMSEANAKQQADSTARAAKCREWILNAPEAAFAKLTFKQLNSARTFAIHSSLEGDKTLYYAWLAKGEVIWQNSGE